MAQFRTSRTALNVLFMRAQDCLSTLHVPPRAKPGWQIDRRRMGSLVLRMPRHGDLASSNELLQAIGSEEVLHRLKLALVARRLDGERVSAHVHDLGSEDVRDLDDLVDGDRARAFTLNKR